MKDCIYSFVKAYITGIENGQISEISLKKILEDKNNSKFLDVRNSLLAIKDDTVIETKLLKIVEIKFSFSSQSIQL